MTVRDRFSDVLDIVKLGASGEVSLDQEYPPSSLLCADSILITEVSSFGGSM